MSSWLTCDHGVDLSGARCRRCEEEGNPSGILPPEKPQEKLTIISDYHGVVGVVILPKGKSIKGLRKEYESILDPGENPHAYDTPRQKEWLEKVREREDFLVKKYGGSGKDRIYGPETFVGWLVKEKGAEKVSFSDYVMAEFD